MASERRQSLLEKALLATRAGDPADAEAQLAQFIKQKFPLEVRDLQIRRDTLSLNSVNGTFTDQNNSKLFFKFHMEESEETVQEYYRAELLLKAGYPVESPLYVSREVGEQILIYPYKASERLADMCRRLEGTDQVQSSEYHKLVDAQQELDRICAEKCIGTMQPCASSDLAVEPLLQLFYWRLVDVTGSGTVQPGGRFKSYYPEHEFIFPAAVQISYEELSRRKWTINGLRYSMTLEQAFDRARRLLAPDYYDRYMGCTAHGDAHNGNVWANKDENEKISLSWFDPAFAGSHIPVLLAEVKSLFHNIFAHPNWLYDSREADPSLQVVCQIAEDEIIVDHNWSLPSLRKAFLDSKLEYFWGPVLKELFRQDALPVDWEDYVRVALFCCPTLVMNLRANSGSAQNSHTPQTSLLGLSIAVMLVCAPENGNDYLSDFFNELRSLLS